MINPKMGQRFLYSKGTCHEFIIEIICALPLSAKIISVKGRYVGWKVNEIVKSSEYSYCFFPGTNSCNNTSWIYLQNQDAIQ